ncbi:adenosine deaminase/editase, partial [Lenzites betulinus]
YSQLNFKPPDGQFTILAGFVLRTSEKTQVVSLGTGSKCLPAARLPKEGDALHDSHAEVLARRGFIRWLLEEIGRLCSLDGTSYWLSKHEDGTFSLREEAELDMYISTVPCGDASTRYLASFQVAVMAALKDSTEHPERPLNATSRGRDNYSLYGVMRTKPGRADSPPTLSMSCSDKIASWNVLGIQGALASRMLRPIYISRIVIGEVPQDMRETVAVDCARALYARLSHIDGLVAPYKLNKPSVEFTSMPFVHSRYASPTPTVSACNDSLCFVAGSPRESDILINGYRRGVSPKHRQNPKFRPVLSKLSMYGLYDKITKQVGVSDSPHRTYYESKLEAVGYQSAKAALRGTGCPFEGWVVSGQAWESFDVSGS